VEVKGWILPVQAAQFIKAVSRKEEKSRGLTLGISASVDMGSFTRPGKPAIQKAL
jgi:hypothetical protein